MTIIIMKVFELKEIEKNKFKIFIVLQNKL